MGAITAKRPVAPQDEIVVKENGVPSKHISTTANLTNRLNVMGADLENSLATVSAEIEGQEEAYTDTVSKARSELETRLASLKIEHDEKMRALLKVRDDLHKAAAIIAAGLDKANEDADGKSES